VALASAGRFGEVRAAVPFTPAGDGHDTIPAFVNGNGPFAPFRPAGPPAMILGMDLMQGYRLVYDHEAKHFWFTPSSCNLDPAK
jgi:hypothetical protein